MCSLYVCLIIQHCYTCIHIYTIYIYLLVTRSEAQAHVCLPVHSAPWWVLLQHCIMLRLFSIIECGISRAFPTLYVYSKFGHHPHPLGYLCACFFCSLHCWAIVHGEKSHTQSLTQLIWCPGTEAQALPKMSKSGPFHREKQRQTVREDNCLTICACYRITPESRHIYSRLNGPSM